MSEYSDIDQIAALQREQENIDQALTLLDDWNGTVPAYTVAGGPTAPGDPIPPAPVLITMADPPQSMLAGIRTGLIQRYNEINQELRDLGVTGTLPDHAGGPPAAETQPA